jgi:hypothetical protein
MYTMKNLFSPNVTISLLTAPRCFGSDCAVGVQAADTRPTQNSSQTQQKDINER